MMTLKKMDFSKPAGRINALKQGWQMWLIEEEYLKQAGFVLHKCKTKFDLMVAKLVAK